MFFYQLSRIFIISAAGLLMLASANAQTSTVAANGWANNSVNTVIFRKNSLVTANDVQYTAFYDQDQYLVLAKRKLGSANWQIKKTSYKGDAADAHKCICIMVDGEGYLHVTWGHHNQPLNYCRSVSPGSLELSGKLSMTGTKENRVTYPEFYKLPSGDLLFFYRDGESGNGNLILNRYNLKSKSWKRVQDNLIDGEAQRNAYWQIAMDRQGILHISWVWRETPDVASNHDLCYARSHDGGITWEKSTGEKYHLPVTAATAEYACHIPENSELINQTAMFADDNSRPYIATYWRNQGDSVPQYHIVFKIGKTWNVMDLKFRKTDFSLSGMGTKRTPISRPQIVAWNEGKNLAAALIFRDQERGNKPSVAVNRNMRTTAWKVTDLAPDDLGSWEPTYDTELWKSRKTLDLFIQRTTQLDGEGKATVAAQPVRVIEWKP